MEVGKSKNMVPASGEGFQLYVSTTEGIAERPGTTVVSWLGLLLLVKPLMPFW